MSPNFLSKKPYKKMWGMVISQICVILEAVFMFSPYLLLLLWSLDGRTSKVLAVADDT